MSYINVYFDLIAPLKPKKKKISEEVSFLAEEGGKSLCKTIASDTSQSDCFWSVTVPLCQERV